MTEKLVRPQIIAYHEADCGFTVHNVAWVPASPRLLAVGTTLQNRGALPAKLHY